MNQAATLTTGWEPGTPLDDSILRQFVFAYAGRVARMARATDGSTSCASRSGSTPINRHER